MLRKIASSWGIGCLIALAPSVLKAQVSNGGTGSTTTDGRLNNTIQTGVPFLLIAPDARAGAMGDVGAAVSPDENSIHWNASKLAFVESPTRIGISYVPWLRNIVSDINLSYLAFYHRTSDRNVIGGSVRYFSLGSIQQFDANQNSLGVYNPNELAVDFAFARKFGEKFSAGIAARYLRSSFSNGQFVSGQQLQAATGFAFDFSGYYKTPATIWGRTGEWRAGLNFSNIGPKVSYSTNGTKYSLPTNMKIGGAATIDVDADNKLTVALDINKVLVPIQASYDPNSSVVSSIFGSFGDGSNQLKDLSYSLGAEYWLKEQFALRMGYFYEDPSIGSRQYVTAGAGFRYQSFCLDVAYILANPQTSPLARTLRFTLALNFGKQKS